MGTKIRSTMRPDEEIEVSDRELRHMRGLGIVADTQATTDEGAVRSVTAKQRAAADPAKPTRKRATARKSTAATVVTTPPAAPPVVADSAPVAQNPEG